MRVAIATLSLMCMTACFDDVNQVAGTGAVYTTRCSSSMEVKEGKFEARCTPASCTDRFKQAAEAGEEHRRDAEDPGRVGGPCQGAGAHQ